MCIHLDQSQREDRCGPEAEDGRCRPTHITTFEPGSHPGTHVSRKHTPILASRCSLLPCIAILPRQRLMMNTTINVNFQRVVVGFFFNHL